MKVLSLNLHSYFEERTYWCFYNVAKGIAEEKYDVVCLQEVNQLICSEYVKEDNGFDLRVDNAAYVIKLILANIFNLNYNVIWTKAKILDGLIEEGEAILTPHKVKHIDSLLVSKVADLNDWRRRENLHLVIEKNNINYNLFSIHFGWNDDKESFKKQFDKFIKWIEEKDENLIIAGDFNIRYGSEEYNYISKYGLIDIGERCNFECEPTAFEEDGTGIRIDYILTNIVSDYNFQIKFNGDKEDRVSDHYGIMAEIE